MLLCAALLSFAVPDEAHAQTDTSLVSNLNQSTVAGATAGKSGSNNETRAQRFSTGNHDSGYALATIVADLGTVGSDATPTVRIFSADTDGNPGSSLYTLTNPASLTSNSQNTFTAPAGATLEKQTRYFVVFEETSDEYAYDINATTSNSQQGANGWSINDDHHLKREALTGGGLDQDWHTNFTSLKIQVRGYELSSDAICPLSRSPTHPTPMCR